MPAVHKFVKLRAPDFRFSHFQTPRFRHGDTDVGTGSGVLVLKDLSARGFSILDRTMMLLDDAAAMGEAAASLAEFHAASHAFHKEEENSNPTDCNFDIFSPEEVMWIQEDMVEFLESMSHAASEFLDSIPGEQHLAKYASLLLVTTAVQS